MARSIKSVISVICLMFCIVIFAGCTAPAAQSNDVQNDPVAQNRQYMAALNQMSEDLSSKMTGFTDAVSRNDTVGMRTQADDAFKVIERMKEQEAPEDLAEVKDGYMEACEGFENALNSFISLYEDMSSSDSSFNDQVYSERLKTIQDEYSQAADLLSQTDEKVAELQK